MSLHPSGRRPESCRPGENAGSEGRRGWRRGWRRGLCCCPGLAGGQRLFQCLKQAVNRISVSITLTEMLSADFIFCTFLL